MLDMTPLDLPELETYGFWTIRQGLQEMPNNLVGLAVQAQEVADRAYRSGFPTSLEEAQFRTSIYLETLNRDLKHRLGNILGTAELKCKVLDNHTFRSEVWIEYTGIKQSEADKLPRFVQEALYTKYLPDYRRLQPLVAAEQTTRRIAQMYIGSKLTENVKHDIASQLASELSKSYQNVRTEVHRNQIQISLSLGVSRYQYNVDLGGNY